MRDSATDRATAGRRARVPATGRSIADRYRDVRARTESLAAPLEPEDMVVQSMPDASPTRWHLAHTTWFFETFVLAEAIGGYRPYDPAYAYLFNSYYNLAGPQYPRPRRGLLTRPTVAEVHRYRARVDERMGEFLARGGETVERLLSIVELGINHEQQHDELILTDIKHLFAQNPLRPAYRADLGLPASDGAPIGPQPLRWVPYTGGLREIGHTGDGFAYDNETPRHRAWIEPFGLANRPVTNGEYRAFIEDGGYRRPELWLSAGWNAVREHGWEAPLYWVRDGDSWGEFTLGGLVPLDDREPVVHVSHYEADAYAAWAGARLPTEGEWEIVAADVAIAGNLDGDGVLHPTFRRGARPSDAVAHLFGNAWEWTASPYVGYPGYRPPPGAIGEYNGKFMNNQIVLRGGSIATPRDHIRATYRNFFPSDARWQFSGIRLATGADTDRESKVGR